MVSYQSLSKDLQYRIQEDREQHKENPYAFRDENIVRRLPGHDIANLWRPAFVRDVEKILHVPYYNRYSDKTQVFSFYKNDDISRRSLHVQLVSRIARNIGQTLNLNTDLIEAIALGHDIGHTPFGHAGERILSALYQAQTGRYFNHNVHSVRVLDEIMQRNLSLQTLDGILCHNGELEQKEYKPCNRTDFTAFDQLVEECYVNEKSIGQLVPATLEACVVRICDIIAYLGKDRQDAIRLGILPDEAVFKYQEIGRSNAQIINNLVVNIIEHSYGKPYLLMEDQYFDALRFAKNENYSMIYGNADANQIYDTRIRPMFEALYEKLLKDIKMHNEASLIYTHHIQYVEENTKFYQKNLSKPDYRDGEPNQIVVDYIASMTDDYFIDLYKELFPKGKYGVEYKPYFNNK